MNIQQAKTLSNRDSIEHKTLKNADGTPLRARVNGQVKTWKRDTSRFQVPMKHGLYDYFYIDQDNYLDWRIA